MLPLAASIGGADLDSPKVCIPRGTVELKSFIVVQVCRRYHLKVDVVPTCFLKATGFEGLAPRRLCIVASDS